MLFNSYIFLFGFLPITLAGFFGLSMLLKGQSRRSVVAAWLVFASFVYYGWWNPSYVSLIGGSIIFNYALGLIVCPGKRSQGVRKAALIFGVATNLALLGYFKYAMFFTDAVNAVAGTDYSVGRIVLPLAISFFTFQQVAYLVDAYSGEAAEYSFLDYCLFVTFFPQLIAGPIVHHKEMLPQFAKEETYRISSAYLSAGATFFTMGLFKKVVFADSVAGVANQVFNGAAAGLEPTFFDAWSGSLAYTMQLYFDFSGYSDMAIGLALLFGIRLPVNFDSPYKAVNIADFWRRWHITLSRFLRDYLYIPLGGNRKGPARRYTNLMITMLLGGLWHGAGWTFVVWGGLHGLYLCIHRAFGAIRERLGFADRPRSFVGVGAARALTFLAVIVGWVFFRATSFDAALAVLRGMAGLNGPSLSTNLGVARGDVVLLLPPLLLIALFAPNSNDIMANFMRPLGWRPHEPNGPLSRLNARVRWRPTLLWGIATGLALFWALLYVSRAEEFLYFQF